MTAFGVCTWNFQGSIVIKKFFCIFVNGIFIDYYHTKNDNARKKSLFNAEIIIPDFDGLPPLGAVHKELIEDNMGKWSGPHLFDLKLIPAIILSNRNIKKFNPSIYDIAHGILKNAGFRKKELEAFDLGSETIFN